MKALFDVVLCLLQENGDCNIQQQRKHNNRAFSLAGSGEQWAFFSVNLILEWKTKLFVMFLFLHDFLSCSVVSSKDFEEQKPFNYNEEKGKGNQEKRSLMSNDIGEDEFL